MTLNPLRVGVNRALRAPVGDDELGRAVTGITEVHGDGYVLGGEGEGLDHPGLSHVRSSHDGDKGPDKHVLLHTLSAVKREAAHSTGRHLTVEAVGADKACPEDSPVHVELSDEALVVVLREDEVDVLRRRRRVRVAVDVRHLPHAHVRGVLVSARVAGGAAERLNRAADVHASVAPVHPGHPRRGSTALDDVLRARGGNLLGIPVWLNLRHLGGPVVLVDGSLLPVARALGDPDREPVVPLVCARRGGSKRDRADSPCASLDCLLDNARVVVDVYSAGGRGCGWRLSAAMQLGVDDVACAGLVGLNLKVRNDQASAARHDSRVDLLVPQDVPSLAVLDDEALLIHIVGGSERFSGYRLGRRCLRHAGGGVHLVEAQSRHRVAAPISIAIVPDHVELGASRVEGGVSEDGRGVCGPGCFDLSEPHRLARLREPSDKTVESAMLVKSDHILNPADCCAIGRGSSDGQGSHLFA
eukprot:751286-Hanusia_phi.AAC.6